MDVDILSQMQDIKFHPFIDMLPPSFQKFRRKGMALALDFHLKTSYTKRTSPYIKKNRSKASTNQFWWFATLIWINALEPVILAVRLVHHPQPHAAVALGILKPWMQREHVTLVLGDAGFYQWDLIAWLKAHQVLFIIRAFMNTGTKPLAHPYVGEFEIPNSGLILDYTMKKRHTKSPCPIQLLLWNDQGKIIAFGISPLANWKPAEAWNFYRHRFVIETYYRMVHHFQPFSCSQHPTIRFMLVSLAFWLCNVWCYFKASVKFLKTTSRRVIADICYPTTLFRESMLESWFVSIR